MVSVAFYTECLNDVSAVATLYSVASHCSNFEQIIQTHIALVALPDSGRGVSRWPAALVQEGCIRKQRARIVYKSCTLPSSHALLLWHRPQACLHQKVTWEQDHSWHKPTTCLRAVGLWTILVELRTQGLEGVPNADITGGKATIKFIFKPFNNVNY